MSPNNSGSRIGEVAGGARAGRIQRINYEAPMSNNHAEASPVDMTQRLAERARFIRGAMVVSARQLMVLLPPSQRSADETMKLKDMARDRCAVTDENMAFVMVLQDRVASNGLSENLRGVEVRGRAELARECIYDLSESEQPVDAEADLLQLKLARDKSPARLQQIVEVGPRIIAAWRRMVDVAHCQLGRAS